jgi:hypothetical protein
MKTRGLLVCAVRAKNSSSLLRDLRLNAVIFPRIDFGVYGESVFFVRNRITSPCTSTVSGKIKFGLVPVASHHFAVVARESYKLRLEVFWNSATVC